MRFDPNFPTQIQVQDFTCSVRTVMMMLDSIGIDVTPAEAQDAMVPRYVTSDLGLRDARGNGIVEVLRDRWGVKAANQSPATFDAVAAVAGRMPAGIGLRDWGGPGLGHWSAVRGFDGTRLILANPAGTGPRFGQQTLTREEFDARGGASLVVIPVESVQEPIPMPEYPTGIDVSVHQGAIRWHEVATADLAFCFIKATEAADFEDRQFRANWGGAASIGLARGAYDFGRPDLVQPEDEAAYFLRTVGPLQTGDMLVLDLEDYNGSLSRAVMPVADWTVRWVRHVKTAVGFQPLIYTNAGVVLQYNLAQYPELAECGLWLASWGVPTPPSAPSPWSVVAFHQYEVAQSSPVPGISGALDMNRFVGPADRIALYGKPGAAPQPAPSTYAYVLGFADLAARLGTGVVGQPLENEHQAERAGHPINHQLTDRGEMVYYIEQNVARFYPAA